LHITFLCQLADEKNRFHMTCGHGQEEVHKCSGPHRSRSACPSCGRQRRELQIAQNAHDAHEREAGD
jgi:hypothetical protein